MFIPLLSSSLFLNSVEDYGAILLLLSRQKGFRISYGSKVLPFLLAISSLIHSRAVKFIRDQANSALAIEKETNSKDRGPYNTAQIAASALRKILKGDNSTKISVGDIRESTSQAPGKVEPLEGWSEGVSLLKGHCCLLLKPQIVMSGDGTADKCIVAAAQAKLQSFAIMDLLNLDDPISGKVMSRYPSTLHFTSFSSQF
jgi:hypothetical protein